jgi:hypothetical protein
VKTKSLFVWVLLVSLLIIIYIPLWIAGTMAVAGHLPNNPSEPGLVEGISGMLVLSAINTLLIVGFIVSSRWRGWRLALFLAVAYYVSFTFITQVETLYYLTDITVSPGLVPRLFIMGLPVPFLFIPLAVIICGKWNMKESAEKNPNEDMPTGQLIVKFGVITLAYLVIYWIAGYFIAWQNPELRAFYGSPGEIIPFWEHTFNTFRNEPDLIILQLLRGLLFAIVAYLMIYGSEANPRVTALLVAMLFGVPHLGHILPNPLMPIASVRFSHMIETTTSMFLFGLLTVWLLHRRHRRVKDWLAYAPQPLGN